jgi:hypothetical protein
MKDSDVHSALSKLQADNGCAHLAAVTVTGNGKDKPSDGSDKRPSEPKKDRIRILLDTMLSACYFAHHAGHKYAIPKPSPWADILGPPGIAQSFGEQLKLKIMRLARSNPDLGVIGEAVAKTVMDNLAADAEDGPETSISLRFHHISADQGDERVYVDLAQDNGHCIEIRADAWEVLDRAPDGVIFRRSGVTRQLSEPVRGGSVSQLAEILSLPSDSDEFRLIAGWVIGLPFAESVRPGVLLVGSPGYGKSTRLCLATSIWEPSSNESLGSRFGQNHLDDSVRAYHRAVPLWDNLTNVSGNTSDVLCTLVTGTAIETRTLYSNADLVHHSIKRPVGLTAIAVPAGLRPDALDRLIVVELPPITERRPDATIQREFNDAHPALLGAFCDAVSMVLAGRALADEPKQYRMAAYAGNLAALDAITAFGRLKGCPTGLLAAYDSALREFRQRTAADDAFGGPLLEFMRTQPARVEVEPGVWQTTWEGRASHLRRELMMLDFDTSCPGFPSSDRGIPAALDNLRHSLAELGLTYVTLPKSRGYARYRLTLRGGQELWET